MSARFYFDIEDGRDVIRDETGVEAADLDEALAEARSVIAEMTGEIKRSPSGGPLHLIVRNAEGTPVGRVIIR
ncbi:DUF6894 family protein [Methylobacterium sp. P31]